MLCLQFLTFDRQRITNRHTTQVFNFGFATRSAFDESWVKGLEAHTILFS